MQPLVPVICETPHCETVWFSNSIFGTGPLLSVQSIGNKACPCPKCKGTGKIPDGIYTHASARIFNTIECNLVLYAIEFLRNKALNGANAEEIKTEISRKFPFLSSLSRFLPKNAAELAAYFAIIVMVCLHFSKQKPDSPNQIVHVEVNISQALEQVFGDLKNIQQKNQGSNRQLAEQENEPEKIEKPSHTPK